MLDHLSLGVRDLGKAIAFFDATFAPLGYRRQHDNAKEASYGPGSDRTFWLYPIAANEAVEAAGMHVAFAAPSRAASMPPSRPRSPMARVPRASRRTGRKTAPITTARWWWIPTAIAWKSSARRRAR